MLTEFNYLAPDSEGDLLKMLISHKGKARLLAGGTNLIVDIRSGLMKPEYVIDLKKIFPLKEITFSEEKGLYIGSCVTCNELIENEIIKKRYPVLIEAAKELASYQIRNRATITGNICYASPAADMAPALLILSSSVLIVGEAGERTVPLKEFFAGVKKTILKSEEFVKGIIIPVESSFMKGAYKKLKRVKGHDLSIVGVAMGKIKNTIRVAIGACGHTPVVLEDFSETTPLSVIIEKAMKAISPIDDLRGSADYRRHIVGIYIKRLYSELELGGEK